jgi:hypothetical protein
MILLAKMVADEETIYRQAVVSGHWTPASRKALPFSAAMPALW